MRIATRSAYYLSTIAFLLAFANAALSQENREYILKVDYGPISGLSDFWNSWEINNGSTQANRFFPNVFNPSGFNMRIQAECGGSSSNNCTMGTRHRAGVVGSIQDDLVQDGLFVTARRMTVQIQDLAAGTYDFKAYFHDALHSSDVRIGVRVFDSRSPSGFLLSNTIRSSTGRNEPIISTFTFPIESDGQSPISLVFTSSIDGFWLNGFELTKYRFRERSSDGVEFIPSWRYMEGLITAFLSGNRHLLGCIGRDENQNIQLGFWSPDNDNRCLRLGILGEQELLQPRLIKFDPYFEWRYSEGGLSPAAANLSGDPGRRFFACMVQIPGGEYLAGVINHGNSCMIVHQGQLQSYTSYWIFARRN